MDSGIGCVQTLKMFIEKLKYDTPSIMCVVVERVLNIIK